MTPTPQAQAHLTPNDPREKAKVQPAGETRLCGHCKQPLLMRVKEGEMAFAVRSYCGRHCARRGTKRTMVMPFEPSTWVPQ